MDRTYILHRIYTSENSAKHRNTQLSEMYPDVAGTKEAKVKDVCYSNPFYVARELAGIQSY